MRVHQLGLKGFAMADMPKVVTARVAARYVGLSESTLAKLRLNGNGPLYCKLGRRVVYRPTDLDQWLLRHIGRRC
jgi:predicted DNA-binding transcriptional regulator AlpA